MLILTLLMACRPSACTKDDIEYTFIDGFISRSSLGGFNDIYGGECGIWDGLALCGDLTHWLHRMPIRQVSRGADCVLDGVGEIRCPIEYAPLTLVGPFDRYSQSFEFVCGVGEGKIRCEQTQRPSDHDSPVDPPFEPIPVFQFPADRTWVDVTGIADRMCGLDDTGRVLCNPGDFFEFEFAGRWDRLQSGCAFTEDGEGMCVSLTFIEYGDLADGYPCEGVTFFDRSSRGYCFDTVEGASGCFDSPSSSNGYFARPRPSQEANQIGDYPRCGLEPGGFIVCGEAEAGDVDRPEYVVLINLP